MVLEMKDNRIALPCALVPAMQDIMRIYQWPTLGMPELCVNWLCFRRDILSVQQRCTTEMGRCHILSEGPHGPFGVTEVEINPDLRELHIEQPTP